MMRKTCLTEKYHFDVNNQWPKTVYIGLGIYRANNKQEYDNLIKLRNKEIREMNIFVVGMLIFSIVAFVCMVLFI